MVCKRDEWAGELGIKAAMIIWISTENGLEPHKWRYFYLLLRIDGFISRSLLVVIAKHKIDDDSILGCVVARACDDFFLMIMNMK